MAMPKTLWTAVFASALMMPVAARAVDSPHAGGDKDMAAVLEKMAAVGDNHKLMASLVGEWTTRTSIWMAPGQPPMEVSGAASNSLVMGGRYLHSRHSGEVMGAPFEGLWVLGYDNVGQRFFSTWMDNMSTGILYETGSYDAATRTFTLKGEMPDPMAPPAKTQIRTTTRLVDADTYAFESYETHGGHEMRTIAVTYTRKK